MLKVLFFLFIFSNIIYSQTTPIITDPSAEEGQGIITFYSVYSDEHCSGDNFYIATYVVRFCKDHILNYADIGNEGIRRAKDDL